MPVHSPHVGNPGGQRDKMVVGVPGRIRVAKRLLSPALCYLLVRMRFRVREKLWKEKEKRNRYKNILPEVISL
jgi:hypothetical protein